MIPPDGPPDQIVELHAELKAADGGLRVSGDLELSLAFYILASSNICRLFHAMLTALCLPRGRSS